MPDEADVMITKMTLAFGGCPLCSATNSFRVKHIAGDRKHAGGLVVAHRPGQIKCAECKAVWNSDDFVGEKVLSGLALSDAGRHRDLKHDERFARAGQGVVRSVGFWRALRSDPRGLKIDRVVEDLLARAYGDADLASRNQAQQELQSIGPLGRAQLEEVADGSLPGSQLLALCFLAQHGDERWIEVFRTKMQDSDPTARQAAVLMAEFIDRHTPQDAPVPAVILDALAAALDDDQAPPSDPILATSWLSFVSASLRSKRKLTVGETAGFALAGMQDPRAAEILVRYEVGSTRDIQQCLPVIENAGVMAVEALIRAVESDSPRHRARAAGFLAAVPDARAAEPLMRVLSDQDPVARGNAAFAVGKIGDRRAIDALSRMAQSDDRPKNREVAAEILRAWGAPSNPGANA